MDSLATEQKLFQKKNNPTAMRLLVLDFLVQQRTAIRLSDIEKGMETADRITIYRTLKTFVEKGLVHIIDDGTGFPKYALCPDDCEPNKHHDLHVHFYCLLCKETFCLPNSVIPAIALPEKFSTIEINLVVKGICDQCAE